MQIELPDEHIGRSDIKRYITVTNFHDGSGSVGFGTGNQVVCCENTFQKAQLELSKFRHTSSMQQRIDEAVLVINRMLREDDKQMQVLKRHRLSRYRTRTFGRLFSLCLGVISLIYLTISLVLDVRIK